MTPTAVIDAPQERLLVRTVRRFDGRLYADTLTMTRQELDVMRATEWANPSQLLEVRVERAQ